MAAVGSIQATPANAIATASNMETAALTSILFVEGLEGLSKLSCSEAALQAESHFSCTFALEHSRKQFENHLGSANASIWFASLRKG